jgi:hypothetical protein
LTDKEKTPEGGAPYRTPAAEAPTRAHGPPVPYQRKLSNYLIDKGLQLRYVISVTIISAMISSSLGYLIWRQEANASQANAQLLESSGLAEDEGLKEAVTERLTTGDQDLALTMVGVGVGLVLVLSLYLIVMTHKVAGPLYKVSKYFDEMAAGKLGDVWNLRKGDMLQDFYERFRRCHQTVRARHRAENELLGRFLAACQAARVDREGDLGRELAALEAHHKRREQALS